MPDLWNNLLGTDKRTSAHLTMRQFDKQGRPFLLLPTRKTAAAVTIDLYPAQTRRARAAKSLLRLFARTGLPLRTERVDLSIAPDNGFTKFLSSQAGATAEIPQFGILAGNPAHDTQRFIILLFDQNQRPVTIVKAGISEPAKALIEKERSFLSNVSPNTVGIPKLRACFADHRIKAFAMDFFEGESPQSDDLQQLPGVLSSWISGGTQIPLHETAAWQQLEKTSAPFQLPQTFLAQFRDRKIGPTIQHGDYAPWNIKTTPNGQWTVLDWERGDLNGIPGWDWFHYIIQAAILVGRKDGNNLVQSIETLLASAAFKTYSQKSGIEGIEREMVLAYLAHLIEVIKPAEGIVANLALLRTLSQRWVKGS